MTMPTVRSSRMLSVVSPVLLLTVCLFATTSADRSISGFLGNQGLVRSDRGLLQVPAETDAPINELLADACNLGGGIEAFLATQDTSGEVCQLAASVVGRGNKRTYEFQLNKAHQADLSFQVVLQPIEGEATVSFEHEENGAWTTQPSTEEWSSGSSLIYVIKDLKYGNSRVVLESKDIVSTFSLRIEFFRGGIPISEASLLVLKYFREKCCDGAGGECTGLLPMVGTSKEQLICDSAGNHCDIDGHLTHLDLSESNMHCDLVDIDFLASGLANLQVLMLNDNVIKGDLSNPTVVKNLATLKSLEILELGNLPGVTGGIPPDCTAPFTSLIHLGVSNTSIGGVLPACMVNTVHQLEISHAKFAGPFPKIEASAPLRYLIAETSPDSEFKFTGPFPALQNAEHLHYVNFNNHKLEGILTLANNVEALLAEGNMITEMQLPNANKLEMLDVSGNQINVLPAELAQLQNLQSLHVDGNLLTSLPDIWTLENLRDFTAASNQIEGKVPVVFGSMPHLRRLVLGKNKLSGDLNDFSEAIPQHSKLQWLDVSDNQLTGPLFAPALIRLAVFSSMRDEYQTEFDRLATHVFDVSGNQLIGEVSQELLQAYEEQVLEAADIHVDFRDNRLTCPSKDILETSNLDAERIALLGCSTSGGGGRAKRAVFGVLSVVVCLGLIVCMAVVYKRRQARKGWYRDERTSATAYVESAEASTRMGGGTGWFTGKPDEKKQFAAGLDEPTGGSSVWGFLPFMSRSKQPVSQLLGGWQQPNDGPMNGAGTGAGMQLPVSGGRRDMHVNVPVGGAYKQPGAAVTSVELASPMSDVSANSLPRNGGGLIDGGDGDDLSDGDGLDQGNRNMFGRSQYAPVPQNQQ